MHWSARSPADTNATLWAGFHVKSDDNKRSFIHMGDTGYSETLFAAVGRVLGPIDLAAIPIGSYEPRWHMHLQHTDPEGAVRMALNMGCKKSVGVHWGTWIMSDEACEWLVACLARMCVAGANGRQHASYRLRHCAQEARRQRGGLLHAPCRPDSRC